MVDTAEMGRQVGNMFRQVAVTSSEQEGFQTHPPPTISEVRQSSILGRKLCSMRVHLRTELDWLCVLARSCPSTIHVFFQIFFHFEIYFIVRIGDIYICSIFDFSKQQHL